MKDREKPKGTKARVKAHKKRLTYIGHAITVAILVCIIAVSSFFLYSMLYSPSEQTSINPDPKLKAAIVDQLSLTCPNQTFIQTATNILEQAGYTVDYYPSEQVTVDFYRNLPTYAYKLIILRVHSTATDIGGSEAPVALFTSECASKTKYVYEQLTEQLTWVSFSKQEGEREILYFGINSPFVTHSMKGRFQNTIIIMMGCEGFDNPLMAMAFVEKGAKVYVSWNQPVLASHTDLATTHLLHHFLMEKRTLKQSVQETFKEVGADPSCKSLLIYYPLEVGEQTIKNITGEN